MYMCIYAFFLYPYEYIYYYSIYSTSQLVRVNSNVGSTGLYFDQHFIIFFGLFLFPIIL